MKRNSDTLRVHHVGIFCSNIDRSIQWWREMFDSRLRRRVVLPLPDNTDSNMCQIRAGGTYLELYGYPSAPQQSGELFWNTVGTKHIGFYVHRGSFDDALAMLADRGIRYKDCGEVDVPVDHGGVPRAVWFFDPDGTRFMLQEPFFPDGRWESGEFALYRTNRLAEQRTKIAFHHIAKYCKNLDVSVPWYEATLSLKCVWRGNAKDANGRLRRMAMLRGSDYYVALHERPDANPPPEGSYWGTLGAKHISLYTDESRMPDLIAELKSQGAGFTVEHHWDERYNHIPGGYTVAFFSDPDGTTIEINGAFFPGEGLYPGEDLYDS